MLNLIIKIPYYLKAPQDHPFDHIYSVRHVDHIQPH